MSTAKGNTGTISFNGQVVSITREGALARMSFGNGEKRIPVHSITAVQLKPASVWSNGFIQLSLVGGIERGRLNATNDENSIVFWPKQQADFERVRDEIEAAIAGGRQPQQAAPDPADQLAKLAALRTQGILSDEEFQAKKADLLARM